MIAILALVLSVGGSLRHFAVSATSEAGWQVAWIDQNTLKTAHIDATGNVSHELVVASRERIEDLDIASNGTVTILVWREADALRLARLDPAGHLLDERAISQDVWQEPFFLVRDAISVAAGDNEFLLVWAAADKSLSGLRLTIDGAPLDAPPLRISRNRELWDTNPDVVFANGKYHVVWSHFWVFAQDLLASEIRGAIVSPGGEVTDERRIITAGSAAYTTALYPSIAANTTSIRLAYVSFGAPRTATLDDQLRADVRAVPFSGPAERARIVWNGREWLALVDGVLLSGDSFGTIATFTTQKSAIASGGDGRALIVYEADGLRAAFVQPPGPRRRTVHH